MTVPQQNPITTHTGNGIATVFAYAFLCLQANDLAVSINGIDTPTNQYSVTGLGQNNGGMITFGSPPATGAQIVIRLEVVQERTTNYNTNGDFIARVVNRDFDRLWLAIQTAFWNTRRALRLGNFDTDGAGAYRANNNRISNLGAPRSDTDAATLGAARDIAEQITSGAEGAIGTFIQNGPGAKARTFQDKMRDKVNLKDFTGRDLDLDDDNTQAIFDLIEYCNGTRKGIVVEGVPGDFRITADQPPFLRPVNFVMPGRGLLRFVFDGVNGFFLDMREMETGAISCGFDGVGASTNRNDRRGFRYLGNLGDTIDMKLQVGRLTFCPEERYQGNDAPTNEWAIAFEVGDPSIPTKTREVHFDDMTVLGSALNDVYATRTGAQGLVLHSVTGPRINRPRMVRVPYPVTITGQSEGLILYGGTLVACRRGVRGMNLTNPANNHIVTDTHIAPYERGVVFEQGGNYTDYPLGCLVKGGLILERDGHINKTDDYCAVELAGKESFVLGVDMRSNSAAGSHTRHAVRMASHYNRVFGCFSHNNQYVGDVLDGSGSPSGQYSYIDNTHATGALTAYITPRSIGKIVVTNGADTDVGAVAMQSVIGSERIMKAATGKFFRRQTGTQMILGDHDAGTFNVDFISNAAGTAGYDARILSQGGDSGSVSGQADLVMYSKVARFTAATLRGETDTGMTIGTPIIRVDDIFLANNPTVTSDERTKQQIAPLPDEVLDAVGDVALIQYKLNAMVEEKGDAARLHVGVTAQQVHQCFLDRGLDAFKYGFLGFSYSPAREEQWIEPVLVSPAQPYIAPVLDLDGNEIYSGQEERDAVYTERELVSPAMPADNGYEVRYPELTLALLAWDRRQNQRRDARMDAFEQRLIALELPSGE